MIDGDLTLNKVKKALLGDNTEGIYNTYNEAYAQVAKLYNMSSSVYGYDYGLIDGNGDAIPELVRVEFYSLTEGSTPNGNDYDRDIVIISTLRLDKLHVLGKGEQVLAYPGTTLYSLEKALKPLGREPHSVIGSSCIGASVIGGICNNSGGSLVQRGPAYTEMSLFARINEDGKLTLVNHLGIDLGETPEQILSKLDDDRIKDDDVRHDGRHAHDYDYVHRVRDIEADTPAR